MRDSPTTNRRRGWVTGLTSTAYFMVVLDALVVVTALPRMQRDLHVGVSSPGLRLLRGTRGRERRHRYPVPPRGPAPGRGGHPGTAA